MTNYDTSQSLLDRLNTAAKSDCDWELFDGIYRPLITRQIFRMGIPNADVTDIVQDVMTAILVGLPKFSHNGHAGAFRKWLRTLVARRCIEFFRRSNLEHEARRYLEPPINNNHDPSWQHWDREHDEHVINQLLELVRPEFSVTTWAMFERQAIGGKPPAEVAEVFGCTINAAMVAKSKVLRRLRQVGKGLIEC